MRSVLDVPESQCISILVPHSWPMAITMVEYLAAGRESDSAKRMKARASMFMHRGCIRVRRKRVPNEISWNLI